jgi:hypothetical protein
MLLRLRGGRSWRRPVAVAQRAVGRSWARGVRDFFAQSRRLGKVKVRIFLLFCFFVLVLQTMWD